VFRAGNVVLPQSEGIEQSEMQRHQSSVLPQASSNSSSKYSDIYAHMDADNHADFEGHVDADGITDVLSDVVSNRSPDFDSDIYTHFHPDIVPHRKSHKHTDIDSNCESHEHTDIVSYVDTNLESYVDADCITDSDTDGSSNMCRTVFRHDDAQQRVLHPRVSLGHCNLERGLSSLLVRRLWKWYLQHW